MKKIFNLLLIFTAIAFLASCKKEGAQFILKDGTIAPGLQASTQTIILKQDNNNDTVVNFTWPAADFGEKPALTYTLQLDVPSDTTNWANAKSFVAGNNVLTYNFIGKDLNNLLNSMGLTPGAENTIAIRIRSDANQYNGVASSLAPVYTNTVLLQVTTYGIDLYVPGGYQGWDPASAPILSAVVGKAGLYEGYVNITGSGIQYFKYTNAPDWNHTNYGDGGNGTFSTDGAAAGLSVPDGGYYELTANLNNNTWTATKTTWGIIGDATPGGWNNDTQMSYDPTTQVWTVTADMKTSGSFKFRANNAWVIDFGIDSNGKLTYADNPFFGYTAGLNNLSVTEDGNYTITLDLHISGKYTYSLVKN